MQPKDKANFIMQWSSAEYDQLRTQAHVRRLQSNSYGEPRPFRTAPAIVDWKTSIYRSRLRTNQSYAIHLQPRSGPNRAPVQRSETRMPDFLGANTEALLR